MKQSYEEVSAVVLPGPFVQRCQAELKRLLAAAQATGSLQGNPPRLEFWRKAGRPGGTRRWHESSADSHGWTSPAGDAIAVVVDNLPPTGGPGVIRHEFVHSLEKALGALPDRQYASGSYCSTLAQEWGNLQRVDAIDVKQVITQIARRGYETKALLRDQAAAIETKSRSAEAQAALAEAYSVLADIGGYYRPWGGLAAYGRKQASMGLDDEGMVAMGVAVGIVTPRWQQKHLGRGLEYKRRHVGRPITYRDPSAGEAARAAIMRAVDNGAPVSWGD